MKKRITDCVLTVSFLYYTGCYNPVHLTREQLIAEESERDISVVTKDGKHYEFSKGQYEILGDGLLPIGVLRIGSQKFIINTRYKSSILLSDIATIETKELDLGKTIVAFGGLSILVSWLVWVWSPEVYLGDEPAKKQN